MRRITNHIIRTKVMVAKFQSVIYNYFIRLVCGGLSSRGDQNSAGSSRPCEGHVSHT